MGPVLVSWDTSSCIVACRNSSSGCTKHPNNSQLGFTRLRLLERGRPHQRGHFMLVPVQAFKGLYVHVFQLSLWPVILSFEISVKEHHAIGKYHKNDKRERSVQNILIEVSFIYLQIWVPCRVPGCCRKSSRDSILWNGEYTSWWRSVIQMMYSDRMGKYCCK